MRLPKNRAPTHPGEILRDEFLDPLEISQREFAERLGISSQRLNEIINGKRSMTADTAVLISEELGTDPSWWMGFQVSLDVWESRNRLGLHG
jgi:antitoxin HigA-1